MRIAISSRNRLFREGLARILLAKEGTQISAQAATPRECLALTRNMPPHVLIVDQEGVESRDLDEAIDQQRYLQYGLVLIAQGNPDPRFESVVYANEPSSVLHDVVALAAPEAAKAARIGRPRQTDNPLGLTAREYAIARMIARGYSNRQIAETLAIKEQTVKNMVGFVLRKLQVTNRAQVASLITEVNHTMTTRE